jgi:hypothetical protein
VEIKVAGLSEFLSEDQRYRVLVAGVPGSGKTPWAAQWPRPLFLAVDKSCAPSLAITQTPRIDCANDRDVIQALDHVLANQGRPSFEFDTIVLDTVSVLQERIAQDILRRAARRDLADVEGGWTQLKSALRAVMDRLTRIERLHVVVLCHLKDKHDVKEVELDLAGAAKGDLPKDFSFIGHLYMDWKDAEARTDDQGVVDREPVRRMKWRATPRFPILRNPGSILNVTTVDFESTDFTQIAEGMAKGRKRLEPKAMGTKVVGEVPEPPTPVQPAPPDVPGGPVEPNVPNPKRPAAGSASAGTFDPAAHSVAQVNSYLAEHPDDVSSVLAAETSGKARRGILSGPYAPSAEPESEPESESEGSAEQVVQDVLGGEVVAEESDPISLAISQITSAEEGTELWRDNKAGWKPEHTVVMKERLALLAKEGE